MDKLLGQIGLWEKLKIEKRPIVLYGMGDGADKIVRICDSLGIEISGVFASEGFVRHNTYDRWTVESLLELEEKFGQMVVLLAFGSTKAKVMEFIDRIEEKHILYIPDLPVTGEEYFDKNYLIENWDNFNKAYNLFEDEKSQQTYKDLLYYKLTGERKYLTNHIVTREAMFNELFSFSDDEVFVDAGAYRGDTIEEFLKLTQGKYKKIIALEPDGKNYKKLRIATENLANISAIEGAAWSKDELLYFQQKSGRSGRLESGEPNTRAIAIDEVVENHIAGYIKYDVEGAELEALEGSVKTIQNSYPKLLVSAYHRREDLFKLPLWIKEKAPEYKMYLRRNQGYPAWDINLMCVRGN